MLETVGVLTTLLETFTTVRDGPQQAPPGLPVRVHLVPSSVDLKIPTPMKGALNVALLTKSVRFNDAPGVTSKDALGVTEFAEGPDLAKYLGDLANVLGGQAMAKVDIPLAGPPLPPDLGTVPSLKTADAKADNALSGVPGLLAQLVGAIPIPVLAPVAVTVRWRVWIINPDDPEQSAIVLDTEAREGPELQPNLIKLIGTGTDVQFIFSSVFKELTVPFLPLNQFQIRASIKLNVGSDTVPPPPGWFDLPDILVDVPAIGIPTLAALFTRPQFGLGAPIDDDNAVMVLVPHNSPIGDLAFLNQVLTTLTTAIGNVIGTPLASAMDATQLMLFLTGLNGLVSALDRVPVQDHTPVQAFRGVHQDGVPDLSMIEFDTDGDNFGAASDKGKGVYSVLLVGIHGTGEGEAIKLKLFNGTNYSDGDATLEVYTGQEMVVGVPSFQKDDLENNILFPAGATGVAVAWHKDGSEDEIAKGNFGSVQILRYTDDPSSGVGG